MTSRMTTSAAPGMGNWAAMRGVNSKRSSAVKRIDQAAARAAILPERALRRSAEAALAATVTALTTSSRRSGGIAYFFESIGAGLATTGALGSALGASILGA